MERIDQDTGEIITTNETITPVIYRQPPFLRTAFNYDMDAASDAHGLKCEDPSLAQQHDKDDADINTLVKRFGITGEMPILERIPLQSDFIGITDFQTAMNAIKEAEDLFMQLPADTRDRFRNDPQRFLEFTSNEENRAEMEKMGFLKPKQQEPAPMRVIVEPSTSPPAGGSSSGAPPAA